MCTTILGSYKIRQLQQGTTMGAIKNRVFEVDLKVANPMYLRVL